jgi:hypothetical protein
MAIAITLLAIDIRVPEVNPAVAVMDAECISLLEDICVDAIHRYSYCICGVFVVKFLNEFHNHACF